MRFPKSIRWRLQLWYGALLVAVLVIPTFAVLAKELGSLTITGPGIDGQLVLDDPEFRQKQLIDRGYEVVGSGPDEFAAYIRKDSESRARAVKISGARAE